MKNIILEFFKNNSIRLHSFVLKPFIVLKYALCCLALRKSPSFIDLCYMLTHLDAMLNFGFLCKHTHAYYMAFKESGVLPGAYHDFGRIFHVMIIND